MAVTKEEFEAFATRHNRHLAIVRWYHLAEDNEVMLAGHSVHEHKKYGLLGTMILMAPRGCVRQDHTVVLKTAEIRSVDNGEELVANYVEGTKTRLFFPDLPYPD